MMGFGLSLNHIQRQEQRLSHQQKLVLTQLLQLSQKLVSPYEPENPVKGLDGMIIADQMLKDQNSHGVLIGGLSSKVWNQRRKPEELAAHKDVDVLVIEEEYVVSKFQGGIDWWLPTTETFTIRAPSNEYSAPIKYWANGNGVILNFGYKVAKESLPGLHIPSPQMIEEMKYGEIIATVDENVPIEIDPEVEEAFNRKLNLGKKLPKYISDKFPEKIMEFDNYNYEHFAEVYAQENRHMKAIWRQDSFGTFKPAHE